MSTLPGDASLTELVTLPRNYNQQKKTNMSVTIVSLAESAKTGGISIKPFFDPNKPNLGLEKYGLALFDGVFHEEQLACIERNGVKRYITGLQCLEWDIKSTQYMKWITISYMRELRH